MAELISIIVTTYNREDALDAVLRQRTIQLRQVLHAVDAQVRAGEVIRVAPGTDHLGVVSSQ